MISDKTFYRLVAILLFTRVIAAFTVLRPLHPDEIFQTVEFSQFFLGSEFRVSQEVHGHFRNLSWSLLLTPALFVGELFQPYFIMAPGLSVRLFMAVIDLVVLWGMLRLTRVSNAGWNDTTRRVLVLIYLAFWFLIEDSVRASVEHGSAIFLWLSLGLLTSQHTLKKRTSFAAGLCVAAIGIVKYPAGFAGLGVLAGLLVRRCFLQDRFVRLIWVFSGATFAVGFAAWLDYWVYGRPLESLWMYALYNVFSGATTVAFGEQTISEYLRYFDIRLGREVLPMGMIFLFFGFSNWVRSLLKAEVWAFALLFFAVAHLFPAHKEARFMGPILQLCLWAAADGLVRWGPRVWKGTVAKYSLNGARMWKRFAVVLAIFLLLVNFAKLAENIRGELWKPRFDYFVAMDLAKRFGACTFVTVHDVLSIDLHPAATFATVRAHIDAFWTPEDNLQNRPDLQMYQQPLAVQACVPQAKPVFMHLHQRADAHWQSFGCEPLTSEERGLYFTFYAQFPQARIQGLYLCPDSVIENAFDWRNVPLPFIDHFPRIENLPPLSSTKEELKKILKRRF